MKRIVLVLLLHCVFVFAARSQEEDRTKSISEHKASVVAAEKTGDLAQIADELGRLSFEQAGANQFFEATTNAQKAIDMFQKLNQPKMVARCYGTLLWIHNSMRNNDKVEEYARKMLEIGRAENSLPIIGAGLDALGNIYLTKKDYKKSLETYEESLKIFETTGENIGATHYNISNVYNAMNNWVEGLKHAQLASKLVLEHRDTLRYVMSLHNQIIGNANLNNFAAAEKLKIEAKALADYIAIPDVNRDMYLAHALFFEQKGDYKNAYKSHVEFYKLDSILTSESHHQQFAQLETAFHTKEKEQENLKLSNKLQQQYLLFAAIVGALLFLIGLIYLQRKRLKIKNDLLVKEQLLAQKELDTHIDLLKEKTDTIEQLKTTIEKRENFDDKENTIAELLNASIFTEEQWLSFRYKFERVHVDFFTKLQEAVPDTTEAEKRLAALTKLGISGTQIASMLGISPESVTKARYRLRKKMEGGKLDRVLAEI